jgi:hypothetical protein
MNFGYSIGKYETRESEKVCEYFKVGRRRGHA